MLSSSLSSPPQLWIVSFYLLTVAVLFTIGLAAYTASCVKTGNFPYQWPLKCVSTSIDPTHFPPLIQQSSSSLTPPTHANRRALRVLCSALFGLFYVSCMNIFLVGLQCEVSNHHPSIDPSMPQPPLSHARTSNQNNARSSLSAEQGHLRPGDRPRPLAHPPKTRGGFHPLPRRRLPRLAAPHPHGNRRPDAPRLLRLHLRAPPCRRGSEPPVRGRLGGRGQRLLRPQPRLHDDCHRVLQPAQHAQEPAR